MKKIYGGLFAFVLVVISFLCYELYHDNNKYLVENSRSKSIVNNGNTISIMLETGSGSGEYQESSSSSWPTDLIFNSKLSKCTNGGEISWDATNKKVVVKSNSVDNCYAYFDSIPTLASYCSNGSNLASCIMNFADAAGSSNSKIYHHDSSLANGAGDGSYRYSGANPSNYVCFGSTERSCPTDNLYRIIYVKGGQVKLIKARAASSTLLGTDGDYVSNTGSYRWNYKADTTINSGNGSNDWSTSLLNKTNLNKNFINKIGTTWAGKIATTTWQVGGAGWDMATTAGIKNMYNKEMTTNASTTYNAKIGLMYASDYGFAASPKYWSLPGYNDEEEDIRKGIKENWLYDGSYEWTLSRRSSGIAESVFLVDASGFVDIDYASESYVVRPSFNLVASTTYASGDGTASSPIRIG